MESPVSARPSVAVAVAVAAASALVLSLSGCATAVTEPDLVAVHYSGGPLASKEFQGCLTPSTRSGFDPFDRFYAYPTRQISYDATGTDKNEGTAIKATSSDNAVLTVPATVTFTLNASCDTLRKFHETLGSKYGAYFDPAASSSAPPPGWGQMLDFVIGLPLETTITRAAQRYTWRALWNDPTAKSAMEKEANENLASLVERQSGGAFFGKFSVLIQRPEPDNQGLKDAIAQEQTAQAHSHAATAQAAAEAARAKAQLATVQAEAALTQELIKSYGGFDNYLKWYTASQHLNPLQPTYAAPVPTQTPATK